MRLLMLANLLMLLVASQAAGAPFQNLDFEGTLLDIEFVDSSPTGSKWQITGDASDPAIVTPGWRYRTETPNGESDPTPPHASLIDGHIGVGPQVVLTIPGYPNSVLDPLVVLPQDRHSLHLQSSLYFNPESVDYVDLPVAYQTGDVPSDAKSVLIVLSKQAVATPVNEQFSVRFNGHPVEMNPVDWRDFGEVDAQLAVSSFSCNPFSGSACDDVLFYAGNIESIAGLTRELAIRPEGRSPDLIEAPSGESGSFIGSASVTFDSILFSSFPAPGPPVQVPEPSALWLALLYCTVSVSRRRWP